MADRENTEDTGTNRVVLRGRVTREPEARELPSGTTISTFRISVPREATVMTRGSRQPSDWFDCTTWSARSRQRVAKWQVGDEVEVVGAVRRRHVRTAAGGTSMVDIEVLEARRWRAGQSSGAEPC